jgi:hypothetical protein
MNKTTRNALVLCFALAAAKEQLISRKVNPRSRLFRQLFQSELSNFGRVSRQA